MVKAHGDADQPDGDAGDGRPDDARAVEHRRVERDGVADVLATDHLDRERLADRHVDRVHGADRERQEDQQRDRGACRVKARTARIVERPILTAWVAMSVLRLGSESA